MHIMQDIINPNQKTKPVIQDGGNEIHFIRAGKIHRLITK